MALGTQALESMPAEQLQRTLGYTAATAADGSSEQTDLVGQGDVRDDLAGIKVPTLVDSTTDDRLTSTALHRHLAGTIPGAHLVEIPPAICRCWSGRTGAAAHHRLPRRSQRLKAPRVGPRGEPRHSPSPGPPVTPRSHGGTMLEFGNLDEPTPFHDQQKHRGLSAPVPEVRCRGRLRRGTVIAPRFGLSFDGDGGPRSCSPGTARGPGRPAEQLRLRPGPTGNPHHHRRANAAPWASRGRSTR